MNGDGPLGRTPSKTTEGERAPEVTLLVHPSSAIIGLGKPENSAVEPKR